MHNISFGDIKRLGMNSDFSAQFLLGCLSAIPPKLIQLQNGQSCLEKPGFYVRDMSVTSIMTCTNMTHTICIVDEKQMFQK